MKRSKKIQKDILRFLSENNNLVSTREIALKIKRAWHSIQLNCLKLQLEGKIEGIRIGNINAWMKK
ncbi:MAG: hypothetical protein KKF89_02445 [Nanoarchaeota archaeon]|nr:hypothetical protein [Nanoarchaeota archaeon]MBU1854553.1 hypothetical protein [Nanoarchaeota archaeon]